MKDIYDIIAESQTRLGQPLALATLVHAEGSSYRRPGARMLICEDGCAVGSLSGGCIEEQIADRARSVLESGQSATLDFDTRRQFGCHGRIDIFIEKLEPQFFVEIGNYLSTRKSCVIITAPNGSYVERQTATFTVPRRAFVQVVHPPLRLLMCGDGPDSAPLKKLCQVLGWQAIPLNNAETASLEPDEWTAAIVKSHNFGRDFVALAVLLPLDLRYVGLIGPKKRRDELLNQLLEVGVAINGGFFAPAGLDLNAETPEEIALSVIAEIQRVFAAGSSQSLRDRKAPIHRAIDPTDSSQTEWQTLVL